MQFRALVLAVLCTSTLAAAAAHPRHKQLHAKIVARDEVIVTVTDEVIDVVTKTVIVTLEPGETAPATATSVSTTSAAAAVTSTSTEIGDFFQRSSTTLATSVRPTHKHQSYSHTKPSSAFSSSSAATTSSAPELSSSSAPGPASSSTQESSSFFTPEPSSSTPEPSPSSTILTLESSSSSLTTSAAATSTTQEAPSSTPVIVSTSTITPSSTPIVIAPSSTSSTSSAASTPSSSPVSSNSGKRGLAYNDADLTTGFVGSDSQVSWAYNWASSTSGLVAGVEYVPMLWGTSDADTAAWPAAAAAALAAGSTHLLAYNEPDNAGQADIGYAAAATAYMSDMQPFAGQARLGSPAVTNGGAPAGLTYLGNFLEACAGCTVDFTVVHWYDSATNFGYFKDFVQDAYAAGGNRPLWITEFGASGSDDEVNTFLQTVMPWLDSLDYVERYAYFMVSDGLLVSGSTPSTMGETFMSFTSETISPEME